MECCLLWPPPPAMGGCFQRKTHHDVRSGHAFACEPAMLSQMGLDEIKMYVDHRLEPPHCHAAKQRHTRKYQFDQQWRHHRSFSIMQEHAVVHSHCGFRGRTEPPARALDQILHDCSAFGQHQPIYFQERRLAQRVNTRQCLRREKCGGVPRIGLQAIRHFELFEHPKQALGAGIIEVMQNDHGGLAETSIVYTAYT